MSNQLAIAAVTKTLQYVLQQYADVSVTTKSPDQAARDNAGARINLFLYHTAPSANWRNMDLPGRVRPSEQGNPPLALNLYYLLTAYGQDGADLAEQRMLGQAMRVLHDRPVLRTDDIQRATRGDRDLGESDLDEQVEKVRIVPDTLNIEEMSRLWTTFQTQYRVSAAYQAAVVLIESKKPKRIALPVLQRGAGDRGVQTLVGLGATLESIEYRAGPSEPNLPAANVHTTITVSGVAIPGTGVSVIVRDPKQTQNRRVLSDILAELTPQAAPPLAGEPQGTRFLVTLDERLAAWVAGLLTLEVRYDRDGRTATSNAIPLAIAPKLLLNDAGSSVVADFRPDGERRLMQVALAYPIGINRRVVLILNRADANQPQNPQADSRLYFQIPQEQEPSPAPGAVPWFDVTGIPPGSYWVRLRVDGVDSLLLRRPPGGTGLEFDPRQQVRL